MLLWGYCGVTLGSPGQKYAMVLLLVDTGCWGLRGDRLLARVGARVGARAGARVGARDGARVC